MNGVQMLVPMSPEEFWEGIQKVVEQSIEKYLQKEHSQPDSRPPLLKATEVCEILKISKPTLYEWLRIGKLPSLKIQSRRYFRWKDVDKLIENSSSQVKMGARIQRFFP